MQFCIVSSLGMGVVIRPFAKNGPAKVGLSLLKDRATKLSLSDAIDWINRLRQTPSVLSFGTLDIIPAATTTA